MSVNKYDKVNKTLIPIAKNTMQTSPQAIDDAVSRVAQSKQDRLQYTILPTATADLEKKIYQYTGETTADYTTGLFYQCKADGSGGYEWVAVSSGGGSGGKDLGLIIKNGLLCAVYEEE